MPDYRLTPAAKYDLLEIWNYTKKNWGKKQAEKYLSGNHIDIIGVLHGKMDINKNLF